MIATRPVYCEKLMARHFRSFEPVSAPIRR
jgi:hypothetical protein